MRDDVSQDDAAVFASRNWPFSDRWERHTRNVVFVTETKGLPRWRYCNGSTYDTKIPQQFEMGTRTLSLWSCYFPVRCSHMQSGPPRSRKGSPCLNFCKETKALRVTSVLCHVHQTDVNILHLTCFRMPNKYGVLHDSFCSWSEGPGRVRGNRCYSHFRTGSMCFAVADCHDLTVLQPLHSGSAFLLSTPRLLQCWTFLKQTEKHH